MEIILNIVDIIFPLFVGILGLGLVLTAIFLPVFLCHKIINLVQEKMNTKIRLNFWYLFLSVAALGCLIIGGYMILYGQWASPRRLSRFLGGIAFLSISLFCVAPQIVTKKKE